MSLVGHWRLEGNEDSIIGQYQSYEQSNPQYGTGKIGQCLDMTSSNAGIELIRDNPFGEYEDYYSFSLWFKSTTTSGSGGARLISRDASEYPTVIVRQNESSPQELYFYEASNNAGNVVNVNEWHHLAFSIDTGGNNSRLFLDGQLIDTGGVNDDTSARPYVIGGNTEGDGDISGGWFDGKIDDVRLYDHLLSEKEVAQLSRAKALHYKFNKAGSVDDASGQGNDGEVNGPTFSESSKIGSGAYDFSGSNGIKVINNPTVQITGDLTISFWAKPFDIDSPSRQNPIHKDYRDEYTMTAEPGGNLSYYFNDSDSAYNNYQASNMFQSDNEWVHVTAVRDNGNEVVWYRNGEHWQTDGWNGGDPIAGGNDLIIGDGYTNPYNGIIDDVRLYASALSSSEVKEVYEQRASIDSGGVTHSHELNGGAKESFETGSFGPRWNVSNATISSSRSYHGNYSFGSWNDGGVEATWNIFDNQRQIDSFEYVWKEDSSQSGHVVALRDSNGNVVQESGTENPQWFLNNGSGGRFSTNSTSGTNYNIWTRFRFDFDWSAGTYQYEMEKLDGSHKETGTTDLENTNGVRSIRISQGSSLNYYGSGNYNRFDRFKINDNSVKQTGVFNSAEPNEIGPAPESLVGWWPLDGNTKDYAESNNLQVNVGTPSVTSGLGQSAYQFDEGGNGEQLRSDTLNGVDPDRITMAAWINPNNSADNRSPIFRGGGDVYFQHYNDNKIATFWYGWADSGYHYSTNNSVPTNTWSHVVVTWSGNAGEVKFYVNGVLDRTITGVGSGGGEPASSDALIGREGSNRRFDGKIQNVRVYDRALSDAEVAELYAITDPRKDQRLMQTENGQAIAKEQFSELL